MYHLAYNKQRIKHLLALQDSIPHSSKKKKKKKRLYTLVDKGIKRLSFPLVTEVPRRAI